jgi:tetratricopeptide (TPR) repeat protein
VVLDAIGRQLVAGGYSVAMEEGIGSEDEKRARALLPVKRELARRKVLLVVDNLESVLPKPGEVIEAWAAELLGMIRELSEVGGTRVILTSREAPPAPLDRNVLVLPALGPREGLELLTSVLRAQGVEPLKAKEDKDAVERLVDAAGGHARSLVLLGGMMAEKGVQAVADDMRGMMAELEEKYPDQRKRSPIASVSLSLRRLPNKALQKIKPLAVFNGAARLEVIAEVLQVEHDEARNLCQMLIAIGLADENGPYLIPDPALGAALALELTAEEIEGAEARHHHATMGFIAFLYENRSQNAGISSHEARISLTELMSALAKLEREVAEDRVTAEEVMIHVMGIESLVSSMRVPRVLERVGRARQSLSKRLPAWSHGRFVAESTEVTRCHERGDPQGALDAARALLARTDAAGDAYPEAAGDRAVASSKLGRMLRNAGRAQEALGVLEIARRRYADLVEQGNQQAANNECTVIADYGAALLMLGRPDQAAIAYEESAALARACGNLRGIAVATGQLGSVRFDQGRFDEALAAYNEARTTFEALGDPRDIAIAWHQIGRVHARKKNFEAAEQAHKESLKIDVAHGNRQGEATALHQLANLYDDQLRLVDAAAFYRQALAIARAIGDKICECHILNNLGILLGKLHHFDEARETLAASLTLGKQYGHASTPWNAWCAIEDIEREAGCFEAASLARLQARQAYQAYRAAGGEPREAATRVLVSFGDTLRASGPNAARATLPDLTNLSAQFAPAVRALHVMAAGSRDRSLAEDPAHHPTVAVELAILLESLPPDALDHALLADCPCGSGAPFHLCHGAADPTAA